MINLKEFFMLKYCLDRYKTQEMKQTLYSSNTNRELKIVPFIECSSNRKLLYFAIFYIYGQFNMILCNQKEPYSERINADSIWRAARKS